MKIIHIDTLERILLANWTKFIDVRQLMRETQSLLDEHHLLAPNSTIQQLSISRFELQTNGFLVWLEVTIQQQDQKIKMTIEIILSNSGQITYCTSILD
jgi:hypothetical protein